MNKISICELNDPLKGRKRLRAICVSLSICSLLAAFLVKHQFRPVLYEAGIYALGLLDALPNFLYVFCAAIAIPVIEEWLIGNDWPSSQRLFILAGAFTIGSVIYEIIQVWMPNRTFDLLDIAASIMGALAAWQVYRIMHSD